MYHHIPKSSILSDNAEQNLYSVSVEQLNEQLSYLKQMGYITITLDDLVTALRGRETLPAKPVVLTFDDGFDDFYANAYPLLRQYNFKATVYIISGRVGQAGYMTWDKLNELASSPLITLGAHTRTHKLLPELTTEHIKEELSGSRSDLENRLGVKIYHLAYPGGHFDEHVIEAAKAAGFKTAATVTFGTEQRSDRIYEMLRICVKGGAPLDDFIDRMKPRRNR